MWSHRIFDDLIEDENDFVGKVAYSIYKQEKVSWINDFIDKTKPTLPKKNSISIFTNPIQGLMPFSATELRQKGRSMNL